MSTKTIACVFATGLLASTSAKAIMVGQTSDFNIDGWEYGQGQLPDIVNGRMDVDVSDIGKARPVILNRSANWTGNWNGAGVSAVTLSAENTGTSRVWLRLGFSSTDNKNGAWAVTDNSNWLVLNGGESASHRFLLSNLTMLQNNAEETVESTLDSVAQFRIFSSQSLDFRGNGADAEFALDNISAVPVPAAVWLFGTALLGLVGVARRGQHEQAGDPAVATGPAGAAALAAE